MSAPEPGWQPDAGAAREPVGMAELVRLVFAAFTTTGWLVIPEVWINVVMSVLTVVGSIVGTIVARRRVTPVPISGPAVPPSPPLDGPNHALRDD